MSINEKIALVTGASRGLGKSIAEKLGSLGATVLGTATTAEGAQKITDYFKENNIKGQGYCLNITDQENIDNLLKQIKEEHGMPQILVNNAGITEDNIFLRMKQSQWDNVIDTDLTSVFRLSRACIRAMLKARYGRIINITSVVGLTGNIGQANYTAAKAGIIGFSKSVAMELAAVGITINCVAPGFMDSDMTNALKDEQKEMILAMIPAKKMGKPEDIANAVAFLASDEASYITGETINVNGGMYMA